MTFTLIALRIIAGLEDPFEYRSTFLNEIPPRDYENEGVINWRNRICVLVRAAAVQFIADKLEIL